jgi:hypothetical protein
MRTRTCLALAAADVKRVFKLTSALLKSRGTGAMQLARGSKHSRQRLLRLFRGFATLIKLALRSVLKASELHDFPRFCAVQDDEAKACDPERKSRRSVSR